MSRFERAERILEERRTLHESRIPPRLSEEEFKEKSRVFVEQVLEPIYADWRRLEIGEIADNVWGFLRKYVTGEFGQAGSLSGYSSVFYRNSPQFQRLDLQFNLNVLGQQKEARNNILIHRHREQRMGAMCRLGFLEKVPYPVFGEEEEQYNNLPDVVWQGGSGRVRQEGPGLLAAFRSLDINPDLIAQAQLCNSFLVNFPTQEKEDMWDEPPKVLLGLTLHGSGLEIENYYRDKTIIIPKSYLNVVGSEVVWKAVEGEMNHLARVLSVGGQEPTKSLE